MAERAEFKGKMYSIFSSNIGKIGWEFDEILKAGVLRIEFTKGSIYDYWPVKKETFSEIFKAESRGSFIQTNIIKNKLISYEKVED